MAPSRTLIRRIASTIVGGVLLASHSFASISVEAGLDWLQAQNQQGGAYTTNGELVSDRLATFETIVALSTNNRDVLNDSLTVVDNSQIRDSVSLSRAIIAQSLQGNSVSSLLAELSSRVNLDGGIGSFVASESTVLDSAVALNAMLITGVADQNIVNKLAGFLMSIQGNDGAWRYTDGIASVSLTAVASKSLWDARGLSSYDVTSAVLSARQYLLNSVDGTSGLWASDIESALVLIALFPTYSDSLPLTPYLTRLEQRQEPNGSWSGRVFDTALAVQALNGDLASALVASLPTVVEGRIVDRDSGIELDGVNLTLESALQSYSLSNIQGEFEFTDIEAGTYNLVVEAAGYENELVTSISVSPQTTRTLNAIEMVPVPTSAILIGSVIDTDSRLPLASAQISITGSDSRSTTTDANGQFAITDIVPGDISILVQLPGYQVSSASATAKAGQSLIFNPELKANSVNVSEPLPDTPLTSTVRFIVNDGNGESIRYARVDIHHSTLGNLNSLNSGYGGVVGVDIEQEGELTFTISKPNYQTLTAKASVVMGHNLSLSITLQEEGSQEEGAVIDDQEPQPDIPTYSELVVNVIDRNTGVALSGVDLSITGSQVVNGQTDNAGQFTTAAFASESVTIEISRSGYLSEQGEIDLFIGNRTILNVELLEENAVDTRNAILKGVIVDQQNQSEIIEAMVTLTDDAGQMIATWGDDSTSEFMIEDVAPGDYVLTLSAAGYYAESYPIVVNPGLSIDMGTLEMTEQLPSPLIFGQVIDYETGEPIEGALVSSVNGAQSTQTDSNGTYILNEMPMGEHVILISASGYARQSQLLSIEILAAYQLNIELSLASGIGVSMVDFSQTDTSLSAYETVQEFVMLENTSVVERSVVLEFSLINAYEEIIVFSKGLDELGNTVQSEGFAVPAQSTRSMTVEWETLNLLPGNYKGVYRLKTVSEGIGPNSLVLHETFKDFTIEATRAVRAGGIVTTGDDSFDVGENYELSPTVRFENGSNVDADVRFNYWLKKGNGDIVASYYWNFGEIESEETSLIIDLPPQTILIQEEAEYYLDVEASMSGSSMNFVSDSQVASPSIRLDIEQSLSESVIYPNSDKGITVTIQLEGKEYFGE